MVWTAADEYDFKPFVLFFWESGEPSLYKNTVQGLAYRILDRDILIPFLRGVECGYDPEKYLPYCLLVLEQCVFDKMAGERPSLAALREEYAQERMQEIGYARRYKPMDPGRLELLRCMEILGEIDSEQFTRDELAFAREIKAAAALPEAEMIRQIREVLGRRFFYKWIPARRKEDARFLGAGFFMFLAGDMIGDGLGSRRGESGSDSGEGEKTGPIRRFLKHAIGQTTPEEDAAFIRNTFGKPILPEAVIQGMELRLCRELHRDAHLWYAGTTLPDNAFTNEQNRQYRSNLEYFRKDMRYYERSIDRIADRIKHALEEQLEPDEVNTRNGILASERVYRVKYLHDLHIFHKEIIYPTPDFSVDLLLDASSSRVHEQEQIAAQAYIITKSLMKLDIPVQVSAFRSLRSYTIIQQLKNYEDTENAEGIFRFYTAGSNRDGLAFRALEPLMKNSEKKAGLQVRKRILLVLTDAIPADTLKAYTQDSIRKMTDYDGELAVNDTRDAILQLRREDTHVAAVFWGLKASVPDLRWMYGDSFIRITEIKQFPEAVIGLLLKAIADIRER